MVRFEALYLGPSPHVPAFTMARFGCCTHRAESLQCGLHTALHATVPVRAKHVIVNDESDSWLVCGSQWRKFGLLKLVCA